MTHDFHAKTLKGLEGILANELRNIGADEVVPVNRGVNFKGSVAMMYKANLYLRTALRILMPVSRFRATNEDMLYKNIQAVDWTRFMTYKNSFAVDAVTFSKIFRNNHYVELRIKDAIVDQFRKNTSLRPSIDIKNAEIRVNVHIQETQFTISLDSSGESLHKRGYRKAMHPASLSEVLAAGLVFLSGWNAEKPLLNPMCGSGTIALEAAMIAANIFPGITGRSYAFQHWQDFDQALFQRVLEGMPESHHLSHPVIATDVDPQAVRITRNNARSLGLEKQLIIERSDFLESREMVEPVMIIMNPPYGERLEVDNIEKLYQNIGTILKHKYHGSSAWLFTANMEAAKHIGLKSESKYSLFNAGLECRYLNYSLFRGERKKHLHGSV
ncbi:MAG: THUMP domain-containing protein [Bacteroidales bacterium]